MGSRKWNQTGSCHVRVCVTVSFSFFISDRFSGDSDDPGTTPLLPTPQHPLRWKVHLPGVQNPEVQIGVCDKGLVYQAKKFIIWHTVLKGEVVFKSILFPYFRRRFPFIWKTGTSWNSRCGVFTVTWKTAPFAPGTLGISPAPFYHNYHLGNNWLNPVLFHISVKTFC